jgi:hypothetical protein
MVTLRHSAKDAMQYAQQIRSHDRQVRRVFPIVQIVIDDLEQPVAPELTRVRLLPNRQNGGLETAGEVCGNEPSIGHLCEYGRYTLSIRRDIIRSHRRPHPQGASRRQAAATRCGKSKAAPRQRL